MSIEPTSAKLTGMSVGPDSGQVYLTASDTLEVFEQVVMCDTTDGAITVTLPAVSAARGKFYSIKLIEDGGSDVTIADQDDSYDWSGQGGDFTLTAETDAVLLFSDGHAWYNLYEQTT